MNDTGTRTDDNVSVTEYRGKRREGRDEGDAAAALADFREVVFTVLRDFPEAIEAVRAAFNERVERRRAMARDREGGTS